MLGSDTIGEAIRRTDHQAPPLPKSDQLFAGKERAKTVKRTHPIRRVVHRALLRVAGEEQSREMAAIVRGYVSCRFPASTKPGARRSVLGALPGPSSPRRLW